MITSNEVVNNQINNSETSTKNDFEKKNHKVIGIIIAIEDENVYVETPMGGASIGDKFIVLGKQKNFTHPVSKKIITVDGNPFAELKVCRVLSECMECHVVPAHKIKDLKPEMKVALFEYSDSASNNSHATKSPIIKPDQDLLDSNDNQNTLGLQDEFKKILMIEQAACPVKNKYETCESIELQGNTIIFNNIVQKNGHFKRIRENIAKDLFFPKEKWINLNNLTLYYLARKLNYKFVWKYYNNNKTEYVEQHFE